MLKDQLSKATLIVCHPDDENLWFSSVLATIGRIIIVYGPSPYEITITAGRKEASRKHPLPNAEFWNYTESMCFQGGNWSSPVLDDMGLKLRASGPLPGYDRELYERNFRSLVSDIKSVAEDSSLIITHNPWGEYGHEEHVMLHNAVVNTAKSIGTPVWYNNYASDRSMQLMSMYLRGEQPFFETLDTDTKLAKQIQRHYEQNNCWTWPFPNYVWPNQEAMICHNAKGALSISGSSLPINYIDVDGGYRPEDTIQAKNNFPRKIANKLKKVFNAK